jgi:hypothetical protein
MEMTRLVILGAAGILCAAAWSGAQAQSRANATPLKVYAAGEIAPERYSVVRRLWVDEWRSAFEIRRYPHSGAAIGAIVNAAAGAGADGVVNLHCLNERSEARSEGAFLCYALAIKLK